MRPTAQPEPFVDADAVAAFLSVERRQVLEMTRKGLIPAYPLGMGEHRRVWRYKISEVEAAIASGIRKPSSPNEISTLAYGLTQRTMPLGSPHGRKEKSDG